MNLRRLLQQFPWLLSLRIRLIVLGRILTYPLRFLPGNSKRFGPPRRLHYSLFQAPACKITKLSEAFTLHRSIPVTNSRLVEEVFGRLPEPTVEEASVAEMQNGRYFGDNGGCVVAQDDGLVWTQSPTNYSFRLSLHHAFSRLRLGPLRRYRKVIHLTTRCAESNYWHWMMDCLPRFRLLQAAEIDLSGAMLLIEHHHLPFQIETLKALGFTDDTIIVPGRKTHLEAETLIIPSLLNPVLTTETVTYSRENLEFLRTHFVPPGIGAADTPHTERAERIYLSRRTSGRSLANEDEVIAFLEREGFTVVFCENLTVREQARTFAQARVVVGVHGAALTNLVFCQRGSIVVEIMPPDFIHAYYWTLSVQMGLRHATYCEDQRQTGIAGHRFQRTENITIDLPQFENFLRSVLTG